MNTCSLPSCSILAWSVSLETIGKASLDGEGSIGRAWVGSVAGTRMVSLSPLVGRGRVIFIEVLMGGLEFRCKAVCRKVAEGIVRNAWPCVESSRGKTRGGHTDRCSLPVCGALGGDSKTVEEGQRLLPLESHQRAK